MTDSTHFLRTLDWSVVKQASILFASSVVLATSAWWWTHSVSSDKQARLHKTQSDNRRLRSQIRQAIQDAKLIKQYQLAYRELSSRGVIGEESRLHWVTGLRRISESLKLKNTRFEIMARSAAPVGYVKPAGPIRVWRSRMKVHLNLPHEVDLVRAFKVMDKQPGSYSASYCKLERAHAKFQIQKAAVNLSVSCNLDWYTLDTTRKRRKSP